MPVLQRFHALFVGLGELDAVVICMHMLQENSTVEEQNSSEEGLGSVDVAVVAVADRSFSDVEIQMRTNLPHKAVHQAHAATEVIAGELQGN
ncbi:hypothetical protein D3C78_128900 [compost metagenome]